MPNRISCRISPGLLLAAAVPPRLPWNRASVRSVPSARLGSSSSAIHAVSSESRPNTVMNHGAPAATATRSGCSGSKIRSAPRSSSVRWSRFDQPGMGAVHGRIGEPPLPQPLRGDGALHRLAARVTGGCLHAVERGVDLQAARPLPPSGDDDIDGQRPVHPRRPAVAVDPGAADVVPPLALEPEPVDTGLERMLAPSLDPALLDLEQVGEVRPDRDRDGARRGLARQVPQDDVLPHPVPDVATAQHQERAVRASRPGLRAGNEGRGEGLGLHRGQGLRRLVVDQELPPRQEPGVLEEQAVRLVRGDVPGPAADAEARALHEGDRPAGRPQGRGLTGEGPTDWHAVSPSRWRTCTGVGMVGRCSVL